MLTHDHVLEVHGATLEAGLTRDSLLSGLSPAFVASIPRVSTPAGQLLKDLETLCQAGMLLDGTVPLRTWLLNAEHLAGPRRQAAVFRRVLEALVVPAGPAAPPAGVEGLAARPAPTARVLAPATILFLGANPSDTTRLALGKEVREIEQRLRSAELRDAFKVEQAWAVRAADLQECLLRHRPAIVHFSGHGSAAGELLLEDQTGTARPMGNAALAGLFRILRRNIRAVVLNACFSEAQARVIAEHIDCVVGMTTAVKDTSAIAFAGAFYQALGFGESVQTAFDLGCNQIDMLGLAQADAPRLVCRVGVDAGAVLLHQGAAAA